MAEMTPTPSPAPEPAPATPAPIAATPATPPEPTFTPITITSQDQFDDMVKSRLARQKAQFADYDEFKAKAEQFDKLESERMSELEKATRRAADLERELADATVARQESLLRASVVAEAAKRNVIDPDAAIALIDRATLEFDEQGTPQNVASAMDSLLEQRPYLVATHGGARGNADLGARGASGSGEITREALASMTAEQIREATRTGQLTKVLGGQ